MGNSAKMQDDIASEFSPRRPTSLPGEVLQFSVVVVECNPL